MSSSEVNQSLALAMTGAVAPKDLVDELCTEVQKMALHESRSSMFIKKKACLCLLRMLRKFREKFSPLEWVNPIV